MPKVKPYNKRKISTILSEALREDYSDPFTMTSGIRALTTALDRTDVERLTPRGREQYAAVSDEFREALAAYSATYAAVRADTDAMGAKLKQANTVRIAVTWIFVLLTLIVLNQPSMGLAYALPIVIVLLIGQAFTKAMLRKRVTRLATAHRVPWNAFSRMIGTSPAMSRKFGSLPSGLNARADMLFLASLDPATQRAEFARRDADERQHAQRRRAWAEARGRQQAQRAVARQNYISDDMYGAASDIADPDERRRAEVDADRDTMDVMADERRLATGHRVDESAIHQRSSDMADTRDISILRGSKS